jgi:ribosomal protein S27AE
MSDSPNTAWASYRRWRIAMWISLPVLFAVMWWPGSGEWLKLLACTPAMICLWAMQWLKCPRCGKTFFRDHMWRPLEESCVHCGLPKWKHTDYVDPDPAQVAFRNRSIAEMATAAGSSTQERHSRFLLLVVRDDPGAIHLTLDSEGWADINNLLTRANRYGFTLNRGNLAQLLAVSENQHFEWDQAGDRIRFAH